jgi:hypothetical protein
VFLQLVQLYDLSNAWPQLRNSCIHELSPFTTVASLFRIGSVVLNFTLRFEFRARVRFIHGNFPHPMLLTKFHQGRIDGDARQPGRKSRSSVKILDMDKSAQKAILHCIFRVFTISRDPMGDTEDFLYVSFAKLTEGGCPTTFGGGYQLLLAPHPKIVNRWGIALRSNRRWGKCEHLGNEPPHSSRILQFGASSIFFSFHPLADVPRTVLKLHTRFFAISQKFNCVTIREP